MDLYLEEQQHFSFSWFFISVQQLQIGELVDFLHNRKQQVVVNGATSDWKSMNFGVQQGSVLGPVLIVVDISD